MTNFRHGKMATQLQRAIRLPRICRESRWSRTSLLTESRMQLEWYSFDMNVQKIQCRLLSSARPLPEDDLPNYHFWNDSPSKPIISKRASVQKLRRTVPHIEIPQLPSTSNYLNLHEIDPLTDNRNILTSHAFEENSDDVLLVAEKKESPASLRYTGDAIVPITSVLHIVKPQEDVPRGIWPVFRLMDENGEFRDRSCDGVEHTGSPISTTKASVKPSPTGEDNLDDLTNLRSKLAGLYPCQAQEINTSGLLQSHAYPFPDTNSTNTLLRAHRQLVRLRTMDSILQNAQRQGRISFYMTCTGEEAIHIGAGSALTNQDPIFAQYREQGLLMWRGFTLEQFTNQCFSNDLDLGKGRQMPIHYGSRALNYHTVSSPLGTQLPQAVGAAYRLKLMKKPNVAICFFGDGCASTTDFHAALNFAATLSAPVVFFCRNNGYAISTPVTDQYRGDGIVSRATGYGMAAIRVDGNDIFAVHAAVREAKIYALQHNAPVLIEGMTYRLGHHSTSDDSTRYRSEDEVDAFAEKMDPLNRLQLFLKRHDLLTDEGLEIMKEEERIAVLDAIKLAEKRPLPSIESLFEDVYKEMPKHLVKQMQELKEHVAKYPGNKH